MLYDKYSVFDPLFRNCRREIGQGGTRVAMAWGPPISLPASDVGERLGGASWGRGGAPSDNSLPFPGP